jgi:hypothetical protein
MRGNFSKAFLEVNFELLINAKINPTVYSVFLAIQTLQILIIPIQIEYTEQIYLYMIVAVVLQVVSVGLLVVKLL